MARLLHVQASPRGERSYSVRAAKAFLESYAKAHPTDKIETLELATANIPAFAALEVAAKYRILHGEKYTPEEKGAWEPVEKVIADFKGADKLVISTPMWNFSLPYRLKQYIDILVQPGYTFSYTPEKGYEGLVTGRPCMLILARGAEYKPNTPTATMDYQKPYLEFILRFIGFTDIRSIIVEPTLMQGPDAAKSKLAAAIEDARQKALTF